MGVKLYLPNAKETQFPSAWVLLFKTEIMNKLLTTITLMGLLYMVYITITTIHNDYYRAKHLTGGQLFFYVWVLISYMYAIWVLYYWQGAITSSSFQN